MIDKKKLPELIDRYNNNELHGRALEEFVELMKNNPDLRMDVKLDKELNEILGEQDIIELRRKIIKNRIPKENEGTGVNILLLAASVTIFIGFAILAFFWLRKTDNETLNSDYEFNLADTVKIKEKELTPDEQIALDKATFDSILSRRKRGEIMTFEKKVIADNYLVFPPYEGLIGEVTRAGYFKLLRPEINDTFGKGDVVTFSWETSFINNVMITITNNKGQTIFVSPSIKEKTFPLKTTKLPEGLYYFKFIHNDEILYFGKFTLL